MDLTDVQALIYGKETTARRFDTFSKILWPLSLAKFALKVKNSEICDNRGFYFLKFRRTCDLTDV